MSATATRHVKSSNSANILMCKQWWKVCWMHGDQEKYYRQLYGRRKMNSNFINFDLTDVKRPGAQITELTDDFFEDTTQEPAPDETESIANDNQVEYNFGAESEPIYGVKTWQKDQRRQPIQHNYEVDLDSIISTNLNSSSIKSMLENGLPQTQILDSNEQVIKTGNVIGKSSKVVSKTRRGAIVTEATEVSTDGKTTANLRFERSTVKSGPNKVKEVLQPLKEDAVLDDCERRKCVGDRLTTRTTTLVTVSQTSVTSCNEEGNRGGPGMDTQQQQYCLKWNSFGSNLATSFANLWNSESLADVTLYCEGRQFKAHKVILAACSKHFQELFDTAPPSHAGACYVILEATTADNMQALLEFMYKGEVHVSQDALSSFLKSGENLQVKGLSMEMSQDAWVKQQTQQSAGGHQARVKTSPVSGGNSEGPEAPQSHTSFAPIMPGYGLPLHGGAAGMGRYAPPAHVPLHPTPHRRPAPPKASPSPLTRNYRQSSSSSHCGSVAEEPDTRSSPGAGTRYDDTPDCAQLNTIKNNGYERTGNDDMMERRDTEQGAEDLRVKNENEFHTSGYNNTSPPAATMPPNYHDKPITTSPVPKPAGDMPWPPTKLITSKSGGIATADGKKLKCPYCERLYGYETNLRAHIRQRHQGIRVPCPHCSRTFTRNNTVRRHIAREHRHQVTPHLPQGSLPSHAQ